MCLLLLLGQTAPIMGNPTGGSVASGKASIGSSGSTETIDQTTRDAIINWQTFSINSGETTKFLVPNSSSATLNRVSGGNASAIYGSLESNGKIILINPNGILIGPSGRIDTASFLGSTLDVTDADFLKNGNLHFTGNGGSIENDGTINASTGDVYLLAPQVTNTGTITAAKGKVGLAAGTDILLQQKGDDNLFIQPGTASSARAAGVTQSGTILAATAELKAAGGNAYALAINNSGAITATGFKKIGGEVLLTADTGAITNSGSIRATSGKSGGKVSVTSVSGTITNSGTLDASATGAGATGGSVMMKSTSGAVVSTSTGKLASHGGVGGQGGQVEMSGGTVQALGLVDTTSVGGKTGMFTIDPATFTVAASGGDETGAQVGNMLETTDVTLNADNAVIINDGITWTSGDTLTLSTNTAGSTISINAPITSATGGLTINAAAQTDAISASGAVNVGNFILQSGTWTQNTSTLPTFTATHDFEVASGATFLRAAGGNGTANAPYQITDIYGLQGLGSTSLLGTNAVLANTIDASGTVTWNADTGFVPIGTQANPFTGTLNGQGNIVDDLNIDLPSNQFVGLFGYAGTTSTIENVGVANAIVVGNYHVGALAGEGDGLVENSYSTGAVVGEGSANAIGGLVGSNGGTIETSYSGAGVTATGSNVQIVGGLVGINFDGTIENSYSYGSVTASGGTSAVGGLVADNFGGTITDCYASGGVVGGNGSTDVGAFVGSNTGTLTGNFYDTTTTGGGAGVGSGSASGATGDSTATLLEESTYSAAGWSIGTDLGSDTWVIFDGNTRPMLAMEYNATITNAHQLQLIGLNATTLTANYTVGTNVDLSGTSNAADVWGTSVFNGGTGFVPIGTYNGNSDAAGVVYHGVFNGDNFNISNLYIDRPSSDYIGLFGDTGGNTTLENIDLTNVNVTGSVYVGGLSSIADSTFDNDSVSGFVTGNTYVGGLLGIVYGSVNTSYSTGTVTGTASGSDVGGFVGYVQGGTVDSCYSTADVSAANSAAVGGFAGVTGGSISNVFSTGNVSGGSDVGGLAGEIGGTVATSYTASHVSGASVVGGFAGANYGTISQCFWDTSTAGVTEGVSNDAADPNVIGATTSQLMSQSYILSQAPSWNFTSVWTTNSDTTLPELIGVGGPGGSAGNPGTTDSLTGTIYVNADGTVTADDTTLDFVFDGMLLGTTTTGSDGSYAFSVNSNDVNGGLLVIDAADAGNTYYQANAPAMTITGANVYGQTLTIQAGTSSNAALATAAGSLTGDGINYSVSGGHLTTNTGIGMSVLSNYTIDGNITVSGGGFNTGVNSNLLGGTAATVTAGSVLLQGTMDRTAATTFTSAGDIEVEALGNSEAPAVAEGLTLTSAQNVTIDGSYLNLGGGDLTVSGSGATTLGDLIDGVDLTNSVINAQGGSMTITGAGGYGYNPDAGGDLAGKGIYYSGTELETSGTGSISLTGTFNQSITSVDGVTALEIAGEGDTISVDSGTIAVTGNVTAGTASGDGGAGSITGVALTEGTTLEADGTGGSIQVTGNASGGTAIDTGADFGQSVGVLIGGSTLTVGQGGSVTIMGTAPNINVTDSTGTGGNQPTTAGVYLFNGTQISGQGDATMTITGTGGAIQTTGDYTGDSYGVLMADSGASITVGGSMTLTGTAGAVNAGVAENAADATSVGVQLDNSALILTDGTAITVVGHGGPLDASQAGTLEGNVGAVSRGVLVFDDSDILGQGTTPVTITGTGGNVTSGPTLTGGSVGVDFGGNGEETDTEVSAGGALTITGTGGSAPALGEGVIFNSFNGGELDVTSGGAMTITGTGGSGYAGDGTIEGNALPNYGVVVLDNVHLTSAGAMSITGTAGNNSPAVELEELPDGNVFDDSPTLPTVDAGGGLAVTGHGAGIDYDGTANSNYTATFTTPGSSESTIENAGGPYVLNGGSYSLTGTGVTVSTGSAIGALDITSNTGITLGSVNATSVTLDADTESDITQTGALDTGTLTVTESGGVDLSNTGNNISTLDDITSYGGINIFTDPGLTIAGHVSGEGEILIQDIGGNLTLGAGSEVSDIGEGGNVTLVTNKNFTNNSSLGANAIQVEDGNYYLFANSPTGSNLGGLPVDFTLYDHSYPDTNLPPGNGVIYASNANGSTGTGSTMPPGTLADGGTPIPPAVVPQNGQIAPQQPPSGIELGETDESQTAGYSTTGNGIFTQTAGDSSDLANFYGNSGLIGADDTAQLNNGELNNVTSPEASSALDLALSSAVRGSLADALRDVNLVEDTNPADQAGDPGDVHQQVVDSGDVVVIGGGQVKHIPADQAPQPLKDALGNGVMNGLRPGAGR